MNPIQQQLIDTLQDDFLNTVEKINETKGLLYCLTEIGKLNDAANSILQKNKFQPVELRSNLNFSNKQNESLAKFVFETNEQAIMDFFIANGMPVDQEFNISPEIRMNLLHLAAKNNNVAMIDYLLANGADINAQIDKEIKKGSHHTPLVVAFCTQSLDAFKYLLARDANTFIKGECSRVLSFDRSYDLYKNLLHHHAKKLDNSDTSMDLLLLYLLSSPTLTSNELEELFSKKKQLRNRFVELVKTSPDDVRLKLLEIAVNKNTMLGRLFNANAKLVLRKETNTHIAIKEYLEAINNKEVRPSAGTQAHRFFNFPENTPRQDDIYLRKILGMPVDLPKTPAVEVAAIFPNKLEQQSVPVNRQLMDQLRFILQDRTIDPSMKQQQVSELLKVIKLLNEKIAELLKYDPITRVSEDALFSHVQVDLNEFKNGYTLIQLAAASGAITTLGPLAEAGVSLSGALHIAVQADKPKCVEKLLANGADINENKGATPLFLAAMNNNVPMLAILLKHNPLKESICDGKTALSTAVSKNHFSAALILLLAGAQPSAEEKTTLVHRQGSLFLAFTRFYSNAPADVRQKLMEIAEDKNTIVGDIFHTYTKTRMGRKSIAKQLTELNAKGGNPGFFKKFPLEKTYHPAMKDVLGLGAPAAVANIQPGVPHGYQPPKNGVFVMPKMQ